MQSGQGWRSAQTYWDPSAAPRLMTPTAIRHRAVRSARETGMLLFACVSWIGIASRCSRQIADGNKAGHDQDHERGGNQSQTLFDEFPDRFSITLQQRRYDEEPPAAGDDRSQQEKRH